MEIVIKIDVRDLRTRCVPFLKAALLIFALSFTYLYIPGKFAAVTVVPHVKKKLSQSMTPNPPTNPFFVPDFHCTELIDGKFDNNFLNDTRKEFYDNLTTFVNTENCDAIKKQFHFPESPLSQEEADFSLAFVMIVHDNVQQFFQLFQSLYWPQNLYCITFDAKSKDELKRVVKLLPLCFNNVILPEKHIEITWGSSSVLLPAINCFNVMQQSKIPWKYTQIVAWNDFPLKTNREMVTILKIYNGANDLELTSGNYERHTWKGTPPGNATIFKGSFAVTLSRQFVEFSMNEPKSLELLEWMKDTSHPDEHYWPTLVFDPSFQAPGHFPGRCYFETRDRYKALYMSRYQVWEGENCHGDMVRASCVYGVKDLPILVNKPQMMAHKIYFDYDPAVWYCLKEWLHNKTYKPGYRKPLDVGFYQGLPYVKYRNSNAKTESVDCKSL